jgi:hypothetical protein
LLPGATAIKGETIKLAFTLYDAMDGEKEMMSLLALARPVILSMFGIPGSWEYLAHAWDGCAS